MKPIDGANPEDASFNPPPPVLCEYCGQPRHWRGIAFGANPRWTFVAACECEGAKAEKERIKREEAEAARKEEERRALEERKSRIAHLIGTSGLGRRFKARTFAAFVPGEGTEGAYQKAVGYAKHFELMTSDPRLQERNGLFITGDVGTGKTHLAAAVANELLGRGVPVVFATMIDLLQKLKETFETGGEAALLRAYIDADLLIIDDLGKEQPTEWAATKIYQIINARYEDFKPIIVTSNYSLDELVKRMTPKSGDNSTALATVDRLREVLHLVPLSGESHR